MSKSICSLNRNSQTCLPNKTIEILGNSFLDKPIEKLDKKTIINELSNKYLCSNSNTLQSSELCILKEIKKEVNEQSNNPNILQSIDKQIITYFKPCAKGLGPNYWINNTEIDNIQYQLQQKFSGYYYSYIHMIDLKMFEPSNIENLLNYDKIYPLTEINFVNELLKKNNKLTYNGDLKYFGVVCNTDISTNGGKHWFSIFIDFNVNPITIEYFNSSGYSILNGEHKRERQQFSENFHNLADDLTRNNKPAKFIQVTEIEHQRDDTANCGSYSIFYIWARLHGKPLDFFKNNKIKDEDMEKFRAVMWRKE